MPTANEAAHEAVDARLLVTFKIAHDVAFCGWPRIGTSIAPDATKVWTSTYIHATPEIPLDHVGFFFDQDLDVRDKEFELLQLLVSRLPWRYDDNW